ncbi:SHOCT domain-containing protein [Agrilactobacillus fermenti]|uniref:SHOCT domain-containing protein n=2 Tax=Agrilactobacillus fermenti TaxID=2586909 RepID=UPI003A5BD6DF
MRSEPEPITITGVNGRATAYEDHVNISRKSFGGLLFQGFKGEKEIFYSDLKGIEYKKPNLMLNGYIQFITNAELAKNQAVGWVGTTLDAAEDPNAIILRAFKKSNVRMYEKFHRYVMLKLQAAKQSKVQNINLSNASYSTADELQKLATLRDQGIISNEEFQQQKQKLLNQ